MAEAVDGSRVALDSHYVIHWSDFSCGEYDPGEKGLKQAAYEGVERLLELQMNARLTVGISERFRADKIQDSDPERKARHLDSLEDLLAKGVELLPTTFRFDVGWEAFASDEDRSLGEKLLRILHPQPNTVSEAECRLNDVVDADHLEDALRAQCSVFLTEDKAILKRAEAIMELGIRVSSISDFLGALAAEQVKMPSTRNSLGDRAQSEAGES